MQLNCAFQVVPLLGKVVKLCQLMSSYGKLCQIVHLVAHFFPHGNLAERLS